MRWSLMVEETTKQEEREVSIEAITQTIEALKGDKPLLNTDVETLAVDLKNRPVFDKSLDNPDKKPELMFIKMPTYLRNYVYMQDYGINDSALMLYQIIVDKFNRDTKKAYPSQYKLALETGKSVRTINQNLKALASVGLIEINRTGIRQNNEYKPKLPLDLDELLQRFPKARLRYLKHTLAVEKLRRRDVEKRNELLSRIVKNGGKPASAPKQGETQTDYDDITF